MSNTKYTEKTLVTSEKILYTGKLHGFSYVIPVTLFIIGLLITFTPDIPNNVNFNRITEEAKSSEMIGDIHGQVSSKISIVTNAIPESMLPYLEQLSALRRSYIGILFLLFGTINTINSYIKKISTEHCITSKKVIIKRGLVSIDTKELNLDRIEGVKVIQTAFDRMINRGVVLITGVGMEQIEIKKIAEPARFRKATLEAMELHLYKINHG